MRQEYALGEFLKSRYMRKFKLLNSTYIYKEVSKPKGFFLCNIVGTKATDGFFRPMYSKGIQEIFFGESVNQQLVCCGIRGKLRFEFRNTAQGIRNSANDGV